MKWDWVRLQLRFEGPKDVKFEMLSRRAALSGNTSLYLPHFLVCVINLLFDGCQESRAMSAEYPLASRAIRH